MISILQYILSCTCISERNTSSTSIQRQKTKLRFNAKAVDVFQRNNIPSQLKDMLIIIARDGVLQVDIFRRPGNPRQIKEIIQHLQDGQAIDWGLYNPYTLANVAKRFLLGVKDGIMSSHVESKLLDTLLIEDDQERVEEMHKILITLSKPILQLLSLLFGIWFRMTYHADVNAMSVEAVAKSVAGSVFPSCNADPQKVQLASEVMSQLITGFASSVLFGNDLIEYFAEVTGTTISRTEKFKYECRYVAPITRNNSRPIFIRFLMDESRKLNFNIYENAITKTKFEMEHNSSQKGSFSMPEKEALNVSSSSIVKKISTSSKFPAAPTADCGDPDVQEEEGECQDTSRVQQTSEVIVQITLTDANVRDMNNALISDEELLLIMQNNVAGVAKTKCSSRSSLPNKEDDEDLSSIKADKTSTNSNMQRFNSIKRRQQARMERRTEWFLSPPAGISAGAATLDNSELYNTSYIPEDDEYSDDPLLLHHRNTVREFSRSSLKALSGLYDKGNSLSCNSSFEMKNNSDCIQRNNYINSIIFEEADDGDATLVADVCDTVTNVNNQNISSILSVNSDFPIYRENDVDIIYLMVKRFYGKDPMLV